MFCFIAVRLGGQDDPHASPSYLFVAFGPLPLLVWVVFTGSFQWKLSTCQAVSVEVLEQTATFNISAPPAGAEITQTAVEKLKDNIYRLITFACNGEKRSAAFGTLGGEFDDANNYFRRGPGRLNFHISPKNRWAVVVNLGQGEDFLGAFWRFAQLWRRFHRRGVAGAQCGAGPKGEAAAALNGRLAS